jgi:cyclophilin family peptidyl-prolyl cis-trans isomerase
VFCENIDMLLNSLKAVSHPLVGNGDILYRAGTLSMANKGPNTNGSQCKFSAHQVSSIRHEMHVSHTFIIR